MDEVLCPSVFTMGARLTRTILPRRVEPGEKPGYDFAMGYCADMATLAFKLFHSREQQEQDVLMSNKRGRDAVNGRFIPIDEAKKRPRETIIETVKKPAKRGR
ncbi:hypothetical protein [Pseudomonas sp. UMAB-08]|uniref:hypothetical protein n=1 Tax=Pseudomonas sp. UMAB-08 TaxID=1365375 RepID=UPI001C56F236|nr:hypothetical protein [Pseudomonas sp. UMAB-08]